MLNQLVLAKYFGASEQMAAYLIAISLPLTISGLVVGVLGYQLVPALQKAEARYSNSDALLRSLVRGFGVSGIIFSLLCIWKTSWLIHLLNPNLPAKQSALIIWLSQISWLCLPLAILSAIYTAALHVRMRFAEATMLASAPMLCALTLCLVAHGKWEISAVIWGQFFGYSLLAGGLRLMIGRLRSGQDWVGFKQLANEFPVAVAALLIFVCYPFSDAIWGSRIGFSAVSYLGYAQRILVGFSGLVVVGVSTVLFPRLAKQVAQGDDVKMLQDLAIGVRIVLVCLMPAAAVVATLALPVIQLLFQRGVFGLVDARALASVLPPMLVGMIAMSCAGLVFKALFARSAIRFIGAVSLSGALLYFALSGALSGVYGLVGIGIAYAINWWIVLGFSLYQLWKGNGLTKAVYQNSRFAFSTVLASLLVVGFCWFSGKLWLPEIDEPRSVTRLMVVVVISLGATIIYVVASNTFFATTEAKLLTRLVLDLFKFRKNSLRSPN